MSGAGTPGPWQAQKLHYSDRWVLLWPSAAAGKGLHMRRLDSSGEFMEADARRMAAAPELLESVQAAINCIGELSPTQARAEVLQMLTAAAEKATGGEG